MTLTAELVAALKELTDDVSGYVAEAATRELRRRLVEADLQRHQEKHGVFRSGAGGCPFPNRRAHPCRRVGGQVEPVTERTADAAAGPR